METTNKEIQQKENQNLKKILKIIGIGTALIGGTYLTYKAYTHSIDYLVNNHSRFSTIAENVKSSYLLITHIDDSRSRMALAKEFIESDEKFKKEAAYFFIFATLEGCLFQFVEKINTDSSKITNNTKNSSLVKILRFMRSKDLIDRNLFDEIKFFIKNVRNPLFHGDFELISYKHLNDCYQLTNYVLSQIERNFVQLSLNYYRLSS